MLRRIVEQQCVSWHSHKVCLNKKRHSWGFDIGKRNLERRICPAKKMAAASSVCAPSIERIVSTPHSSVRLRQSSVSSLLRASPQAARSSFSSSFRSPSGFQRRIDSRRYPIFKIRASSSEDEENSESFDRVRKVFSNVKDKWDELDKKPVVFLYGGSAILGLWLSSLVVDALDSIPLLPHFLELVGLGYFSWLIYRYLLFKAGRDELGDDIQALKRKITGDE